MCHILPSLHVFIPFPTCTTSTAVQPSPAPMQTSASPTLVDLTRTKGVHRRGSNPCVSEKQLRLATDQKGCTTSVYHVVPHEHGWPRILLTKARSSPALHQPPSPSEGRTESLMLERCLHKYKHQVTLQHSLENSLQSATKVVTSTILTDKKNEHCVKYRELCC